jgi:histidinol-phosphate aminotransferase
MRQQIDILKSYSPGTPWEEIVKRLKKDFVKLDQNENPLGPSAKVLQAIRNNLKLTSVYPDGQAVDLKKILAKKMKIKSSNLILGNGSDEIMLMIAAAFFNPEDEVIIPQGTFSIYEHVSRLFGAKPIFVKLNNFCVDLEKIEQSINPRTKAVFLANPNSPTGTIVTENQVNAFLKSVPKDVLIIFDEAYADYAESKDFPKLIRQINKKNIIILRTFSKIGGLAGLRIGYGIASEKLINILDKVRLPFNVNRLAQASAAALLQDKKYIDLSKKTNFEGKKLLYRELEKIGLNYVPTEANFVFVDIKRNAKFICQKLFNKGVIIRPLTSFGFPNAVRITIGMKKQLEKVILELKEVLRI